MDSFNDPAAYTPIEFRQTHKLGHSKYHELKKLGLGPRETIIGRKHLIFGEDAAAWRRRMTALSAAKVSEGSE